jgi:uncharacterized protein YjiS (DUF1127 family)
VKSWWVGYLTWRIERLAIVQLEAMSDRELEDIGLTRSQIKRGGAKRAPIFKQILSRSSPFLSAHWTR